jgi:spectinomycin phosphotransferase
MVKAFLERAEEHAREDPVAVQLAAFLKLKHDEVFYLAERAERLAQELVARGGRFVLCHSDLHAGNVLIDGRGALYIVDWDAPIMAVPERDLMFAGGAQGFRGHTLEDEERFFYRGYGETELDPKAIAYYRYERIIQDIAVECEQIFSAQGGAQDREQALEYLKSNFSPGGTIEIARQHG